MGWAFTGPICCVGLISADGCTASSAFTAGKLAGRVAGEAGSVDAYEDIWADWGVMAFGTETEFELPSGCVATSLMLLGVEVGPLSAGSLALCCRSSPEVEFSVLVSS